MVISTDLLTHNCVSTILLIAALYPCAHAGTSLTRAAPTGLLATTAKKHMRLPQTVSRLCVVLLSSQCVFECGVCSQTNHCIHDNTLPSHSTLILFDLFKTALSLKPRLSFSFSPGYLPHKDETAIAALMQKASQPAPNYNDPSLVPATKGWFACCVVGFCSLLLALVIYNHTLSDRCKQ